jgi:hypothetical protein
VREGSSPKGLRPFLMSLLTRVPRRVIRRTSHCRNSQKSALEGRNEATALWGAPTSCPPRKRCAVRRMRPFLMARTLER